MKQTGFRSRDPSLLARLIEELHHHDCSISNESLEELVACGPAVVPHLEAIIEAKLVEKGFLNLTKPPRNTEWFIVVHAFYLLAHLRSERSLGLVLEFLGERQEFVDYWLNDLLDGDLWEIPFLLGKHRLGLLESFLLNGQANPFSRLAVGTALVQIALHFNSKFEPVCQIFEHLLTRKHEDSDFVGLICSELLDLRAPALQPVILHALSGNSVWPGLLTSANVEQAYKRNHRRILRPLALLDRYESFRQSAYFAKTASGVSPKMEIRKVLQRSS